MRRVFALAVVLAALGTAAAGDDRYTSKGGRYSAVFPKKPRDDAQTIGTAAGPIRVVTEASVGTDLALAVTYSDYPEAFATLDAKKLLDAVRDGLKTKDAKLVAELDLPAADGNPAGRDVAYDHGKHHTRTRLYLVGRRLYQVSAAGTKEGVESGTAVTFLTSFAVGK